eukprot:1275568-Prymnesium_polylepis.1
MARTSLPELASAVYSSVTSSLSANETAEVVVVVKEGSALELQVADTMTLDEEALCSFGHTEAAQRFLIQLSDAACVSTTFGCMSPLAANYILEATRDDGSCIILNPPPTPPPPFSLRFPPLPLSDPSTSSGLAGDRQNVADPSASGGFA